MRYGATAGAAKRFNINEYAAYCFIKKQYAAVAEIAVLAWVELPAARKRVAHYPAAAVQIGTRIGALLAGCRFFLHGRVYHDTNLALTHQGHLISLIIRL